jgi:hypothetical protein
LRPIKPLGHAVLLFGHLTRELSVMSGLSSGDGPASGWIDTSLDGLIEPLATEVHRWRRHVGIGGAHSRLIAARMRRNTAPLTARQLGPVNALVRRPKAFQLHGFANSTLYVS